MFMRTRNLLMNIFYSNYRHKTLMTFLFFQVSYSRIGVRILFCCSFNFISAIYKGVPVYNYLKFGNLNHCKIVIIEGCSRSIKGKSSYQSRNHCFVTFHHQHIVNMFLASLPPLLCFYPGLSN